jgi:hypothetical protein
MKILAPGYSDGKELHGADVTLLTDSGVVFSPFWKLSYDWQPRERRHMLEESFQELSRTHCY